MAETDITYTVLNFDEVTCEFDATNPLNKVMELWASWSQGKYAPTWKDVELYSLPPIILPQTLVVDVVDGGKDYRYRFWGSDYTKHYGCDETGQLLSETLGPSFIGATQNQLKRVMESKKPVCFDVAILAPRTGVVQTKTNLRLPIMDEPETITKIMTATVFHPTSMEQTEKLRKAFGADKRRRENTSESR